MLTDLLKPELVACHVEASDWEEAIRACGKLLVDAGKCDQSYVDAMISSVHNSAPIWSWKRASPCPTLRQMAM